MHMIAIRKVHNTFWWYGYNHPPPVIRLNGISEIRAKASNLPTYFLMFRVWKYPSTIIKAKIGKANLPTFVIQCWLVIIVAHKWSNSMNTIARTCRPKEVIPIFFFPQFINFFHSSFTRHHLNAAARKPVDPCFPAVHRFTSARVYHGKRTISTKLDTQTVSEGAPGIGQCPVPAWGAVPTPVGWSSRTHLPFSGPEQGPAVLCLV